MSAPACPECGRKNFRERDASIRDEKGRRIYRAYRICDCGHPWMVEQDAKTGRERIVKQVAR